MTYFSDVTTNMARRRRKKNATSKAALEFMESPAGGSPNIPSPVFCSDDPPTADVVPIEDGINFPWVGRTRQDHVWCTNI